MADVSASTQGLAPGGAYGVLIVDDEVAVLESLEITLEEDYRIFTATTAERGLTIFDREDIALVISDQRLPVFVSDLNREVVILGVAPDQPNQKRSRNSNSR